MLEKVEIGSIVDGKVVKIKPFGAIVSLPDNTQGLVHISHISNSFVQDINEHILVGDVVKVKVLSADAETGKISLSIKETLPPPAKRPERDPNKPFPNKPFNRPNSPQRSNFNRNMPPEIKPALDSNSSFEDRFKEWLKNSNERHAGLNKRNKKR